VLSIEFDDMNKTNCSLLLTIYVGLVFGLGVASGSIVGGNVVGIKVVGGSVGGLIYGTKYPFSSTHLGFPQPSLTHLPPLPGT